MTDVRHLLTATQLRMARCAVRASVEQVARSASLSTKTVRKLETGSEAVTMQTLARLQAVYEGMGVSFQPDDGSGAGVRYREPEGTPSTEDGPT